MPSLSSPGRVTPCLGSAHISSMKTASLDFTAIDFEAANSDRASACAIGVAVVRGGIITNTRSWLIKPHTGIESFDRYATRVHGINAQMVVNAKALRSRWFRSPV